MFNFSVFFNRLHTSAFLNKSLIVFFNHLFKKIIF